MMSFGIKKENFDIMVDCMSGDDDCVVYEAIDVLMIILISISWLNREKGSYKSLEFMLLR